MSTPGHTLPDDAQALLVEASKVDPNEKRGESTIRDAAIDDAIDSVHRLYPGRFKGSAIRSLTVKGSNKL